MPLASVMSGSCSSLFSTLLHPVGECCTAQKLCSGNGIFLIHIGFVWRIFLEHILHDGNTDQAISLCACAYVAQRTILV